MNSDGVGQEILSHHYHTHCMTFYNNFLSTSPSVNNELNDKCFLGIVYHVSILLISEKKSKKNPTKIRPTSTLGALQLPLYPPASPLSILPWCLSLVPFCYLNSMLVSVALGETDKKLAETTVICNLPLLLPFAIFAICHCSFRNFSALVLDGACHRNYRNPKSHSEWNRVQVHPWIMLNIVYSKEPFDIDCVARQLAGFS